VSACRHLADFAFSTSGNFSANFIHHLCVIALGVLEIQSNMVDTGRMQAFEKLQDHIAPGAQTQVNRARVRPTPGGHNLIKEG
jgi:hypothetical protein